MKSFGFWQLFLFYSSYVGFFHFGVNDGVYLRYGGKNFYRQNFSLLKSQFYLLFLLQCFVAIIGFVVVYFFLNKDQNYNFVIFCTLAFLIISNLSSFLTILLQAVNRLREFSIVTIVINISMILLLLILILSKNFEYRHYIKFYILAYIVGFAVSIYYSRKIFFVSINTKKIKFYVREFYKNMSVGIKLLISNVAGLLIYGIGRFLIEKGWSIEEFGKVSLAISLAFFLIFFMKQGSLVLFPVLKNVKASGQKYFFSKSTVLLNVLLPGLLLFFPAMAFFILHWLPKYESVIFYLVLFLPSLIYEGKMQIVHSTLLKALRMETMLLKINVVSVFVSLLLCLAGYYYFKSIPFILLSVNIAIVSRCLLFEYILNKKFNHKNFVQELFCLVLSAAFIILYSNFDYILAFFVYICIYTLYLFYNRYLLINSYHFLKKKFRSR
jgi:O-antigen/teichoic acid export membrane protein